MHVIRASDKLRKAAECVRLPADDLVPVQGRDGLWVWPEEWREQPEVINLVSLYNDEDYDTVVKYAESIGLRIKWDGGLQIQWMGGVLWPGKNQMAVAIIVSTTLTSQGGTPVEIKRSHEEDITVNHDQNDSQTPPVDNPSKRRRGSSIPPSRIITAEPQTEPQTEPRPAKQQETHQATANVGLKPQGKRIDINIVRQQPKFVVRKMVKPAPFEIGDIVVVEELEALHAQCGGLPMVVISYQAVNLGLN